MPTVVFYVSGHGFGHASRDITVISELLARREDVRVLIRTSAPRWLFDLTMRLPEAGGRWQYQGVETDTGVVQIDSLHPDIPGTVQRAREFMRTFDDRVALEAALLRDADAALVVADCPPLALAAAAAAGRPSVVLGNFTWDWIYSAYPDTAELVERVGCAYAAATSGLRLPMHGGFATVPRVSDLPFAARQSRRDPKVTRRALGLPADERLVLVSFGGYGLDRLNLDALERLDGFAVLFGGSTPFSALPDRCREGRRGSLLPFDEQAMYAAGFRYEDVVRAVDVVVTKPGYGIISECIANDTALLYTSRGPFPEYDVMVREMPQVMRAAFIDHPDLFSGCWGPHLARLLAQPAPQRPRIDGAAVAATHLLAMIGA